MTREEAANWFEAFMLDYYDPMEVPDDLPYEVAEVALSALRPVSREQVERVFPGCKMCKTPSIAPPVGIYCPWCGAPRTAEAKTNLRKRLEALNDGKGD